MKVLHSFYHLLKITDNNKKGYKYKFVRWSGEPTKLDSLLESAIVATLKPAKPQSKRRPYYYLIFSVEGQTNSKGFTLFICYDNKSGSGHGRTSLFYDNCVVILNGNDLYIYIRNTVCPASITSNMRTSDKAKVLANTGQDSPYQRYLGKDDEILSEMNWLALNATRV